MLITEASISIICLVFLAYTAIRYFTGVGRRRDTYEGSLFMLLLVFLTLHIAADGFIRIQATDPALLSVKQINTVEIFIYYLVYICGLVGAVWVAADSVIINSGTKISKGGWVLLHIPAAVIVGMSTAMINKLGLPLIRYSSLFVAIIIFIFAAWFYERIEPDLRRGLIEVIIGCVLIFVCYFVLRITVIPAAVPLMLLAFCFGSLRGGLADYYEEEAADSDETEASDKLKLAYDPLTKAEISKPKKEKRLRKKATKNKEKNAKKQTDEIKENESYLAGAGGAKTQENTGEVREENITLESTETDAASGGKAKSTEEEKSSEVTNEPKKPRTPPEPIKVADEDLANLARMEQTVAVEMRVRPLILEKDLKENYHKLGELAISGDAEGCEEIIRHLEGYRISGIHVTRFGRIKQAVADGDLALAAKEVEGF